MGKRLNDEIARKRTTKAALADELGYSRAHFTNLCQDGGLSIELLTEIAMKLNLSLDFLVFGKFPVSDPEFQEKLSDLLALLPSIATKPPKRQ